MRSFVAHCDDLLNEEVNRKLMIPLESAMALVAEFVFTLFFALFSFLRYFLILKSEKN